jgi:hypothetical protein
MNSRRLIVFAQPEEQDTVSDADGNVRFGSKADGDVRVMSALPPKADIAKRRWDVRFVPKADILRCGE